MCNFHKLVSHRKQNEYRVTKNDRTDVLLLNTSKFELFYTKNTALFTSKHHCTLLKIVYKMSLERKCYRFSHLYA